MTETRRRLWMSRGQGAVIGFVIALPFALIFGRSSVPAWQMALSFGCPFGLFMGTMGRTFAHKIHFPSFVVTMFVRVLFYGLALVTCFSFSLWVYISLASQASPLDSRVISVVMSVLGSPPIAISVAVTLPLVFVITGVHEISRKLGPGNLWAWMTGKYHHPREEERIFMFLDLRGSTSLAEQLGNLKFSALVRDFFADLTTPVIETKGEVSHYIGDEAVLTWRMERGLAKANCVRCFFMMEDAIVARANFYRDHYGLVPSFKAGLHLGRVVATEVGQIKSELVFHGDVLNTTARIQGLCDHLGAPLLVSKELESRLDLTAYVVTPLGAHELKGKEHPVEVSGVQRTSLP